MDSRTRNKPSSRGCSRCSASSRVMLPWNHLRKKHIAYNLYVQRGILTYGMAFSLTSHLDRPCCGANAVGEREAWFMAVVDPLDHALLAFTPLPAVTPLISKLCSEVDIPADPLPLTPTTAAGWDACGGCGAVCSSILLPC